MAKKNKNDDIALDSLPNEMRQRIDQRRVRLIEGALEAVCDGASSYREELSRTDGLHAARLSERKNALFGGIDLLQDARNELKKHTVSATKLQLEARFLEMERDEDKKREAKKMRAAERKRSEEKKLEAGGGLNAANVVKLPEQNNN